MIIEKLKKIIYLILVLVWMATVFMFSSQNGSESQDTSKGVTKFIVEVLTYKQNIEESQKTKLIEKLDYYVRKVAHYSIYLIGGILIYNYINTYKLKNKKVNLTSIIIGVTYAVSDESHQYFTSGRSAQILDICIDSLGIVSGIIILNITKIINKRTFNN